MLLMYQEYSFRPKYFGNVRKTQSILLCKGPVNMHKVVRSFSFLSRVLLWPYRTFGSSLLQKVKAKRLPFFLFWFIFGYFDSQCTVGAYFLRNSCLLPYPMSNISYVLFRIFLSWKVCDVFIVNEIFS